MRKRLGVPSPALVVSLIALFVALGGTTYAATSLPRNSVGARQLRRNAVRTKKIENGAVTRKKIRKHAVTAGKVKAHSLLAKDFKAGQLPAGPQGPQGPQGATGPQGPPGPSTGPAGGDLTGSYPDPSIAAGAVTNAKLANPTLTITAGTGLSGGGQVALGGSSTLSVADGGIGGTQLADGSITNAKFASGAQAPDSVLLASLPASDYGAVLSGRVNSLPTTALTTDYGAASGTSTANATEGNVSTLSPDQNLTGRDLSVQLTVAGTIGSSHTFALVVNGTATSLSCTVINTTTTCTATGPVSVPAGSTLSIRDTTGVVGAVAADARFALRLTAS